MRAGPIADSAGPEPLHPREIPVTSRSIDPFRELLTAQRWADLETLARFGRSTFAGRPIWCVNSTANGGGVAEMLSTTLSYIRGAGLNARWAVMSGDAEFFSVTKRIHNFIHGSAGDGGSLGPSARDTYDRVCAQNLAGLLDLIEPGSMVILHDPQTAGFVAPLQRHGCQVVWRCHIGAALHNECSSAAWSLLEPYVGGADRLIFSRLNYVPDMFANVPIAIVAPSIDPFAPKNLNLDDRSVREILLAAGLVSGVSVGLSPAFHRLDGRRAEVRHRAELLDGGLPPDLDRPIVLQVSRWDRLKDHLGVMKGFISSLGSIDADLMLAGPNTVADDPEGTEVLGELLSEHAGLPESVRRRVHIASLPTVDIDENAVMVNALQRHATIVVQKSLQEGFGLTVTEAMWKGKPVIASGVGGITDQVSDGHTGVLLKDPDDLDAFGTAVVALLDAPDRAADLGAAGKANVTDHFLHDRHLRQYFETLGSLQAEASGRPDVGLPESVRN